MFVLQEYSCDPNDTVFVQNYNLSTQLIFCIGFFTMVVRCSLHFHLAFNQESSASP